MSFLLSDEEEQWPQEFLQDEWHEEEELSWARAESLASFYSPSGDFV
jgi:deferrochelatase/peroxidase EfeB